jgi:hypothetical protein
MNRVRQDIVYFFDRISQADRIPDDLETARQINHSLYGPRWDPAGALAEFLGDTLPRRAKDSLSPV